MALKDEIAADFAAGPLTDWGEEVVYTPPTGSPVTFTAVVTDMGGPLDGGATGIDAKHNVQLQFLAADDATYPEYGSLDPDTIDPRGKFTRSADSAVMRPTATAANHYGVANQRAERRVRKKFGKG